MRRAQMRAPSFRFCASLRSDRIAHGRLWASSAVPLGHEDVRGWPPVRAAGVAARVSRRPASGAHLASRSSPCGRVAGRWPARLATIADRTTRTPASRGDSRPGSWLRLDDRSGWTSWRPPSSARSRPSSGTRGCELRNLQWLVQTGRPCVFPQYFARVRPTGELSGVSSLVSIGAVGIHGQPWPK
jgi:hypothetical protein